MRGWSSTSPTRATTSVWCPARSDRARLHWIDDEDRDPPRIRRGPRALHVRQRVHHAVDPARDPRRDLLELPPVLHGPAEARGHRWPRRALQAPRRKAPVGLPLLATMDEAEPLPDGVPAAPLPASEAPPTAEVVESDAPGEEPGQLWAQRDAPVGGQAVLEGVMMRGVSTWAVAVRKPLPEQMEGEGLDPEEAAGGDIEVKSFP